MDRPLINPSITGEAAEPFTLLRHPSGSPVYVVGTAHVSRKAAQEVSALISRVSPAVVVLELDDEREKKLMEQVEHGDTYGLRKLQHKSTWEIMKMSMSGEVLNYMMGGMYTITGAIIGTMPGAEFVAAIEAARAQGAQVVLGDRSQDATMRRLQYYTRYLTRQDSRRQAETRRLQRMMDQTSGQDGGQGPNFNAPLDTVGGQPDFLRREPSPTPKEVEVECEVREVLNPDDPWGLGPDDNTEAGMKRRMMEMMREGGCARPNEVLAAARRLFQDGLDPKSSIKPADVLTVRECGAKLVERFRQRAMMGDDTWMQRLEQEQVAGAKGAAGMDRSNAAMKKVIVEERDLILARRLWEAGLESGSQPVVGVVGAGHIKGIARYWPVAGDPAIEARVQRYLQAPQDDAHAPWVTAAAGTAVLGTIAYRRPRAAALFAGAVVLMTAPYLGFMVITVNRFSKFANKLVSTVEMMDSGGMDSGLGSGFGDSGDAGLGAWADEGAEGNGSSVGGGYREWR